MKTFANITVKRKTYELWYIKYIYTFTGQSGGLAAPNRVT